MHDGTDMGEKGSKKPESPERRLWMVNQYAIAPDMPGGRRHFEMARILSESGWRTTIFATPFSQKLSGFARNISLLRPTRFESIEGVGFRWLYSLPYEENNWRRYANMVSFTVTMLGVGLASRRPNVVLGSSPHLLGAMAAWLVARRHRVPFVLEVRDLWPESLVQLGLSNKPLIRILEGLERLLYSRADLIVPLTDGIETGIRRKGFGSKPITLVPNAALRPAPLDPARRREMRRELGWTGNKVAIWIGAHGPANGLEVIVDAARLLQHQTDILFVLIGGGSAKPKLIESAQDLPNIRFMDPVPKHDVDAMLRAADIGVLVHRDTEAVKGARPNKLFDYMVAGLPIVLNMDGEARSIVEEAGSGIYVPVGDPDALAAEVLRLSRSDDVLRSLGLSGFAHVRKAHSREDAAKTLAEALDGLVKGRSLAISEDTEF